MAAGRGIISALVLWLAFSGVAAGEQFYVNESGWWCDGGAFNASETPISAAVSAASAGDSIYVWNGSYTEIVVVDTAHLTLEGEGADVVTVTATDPDDHVFEVMKDYVNISGFTVRGATNADGIRLMNADYCDISRNDVYGNSYGIWLFHSNSIRLTDNIVYSNSVGGISLSCSTDSTFTNNNIHLNDNQGISLYSFDNSILANNNASNNGNGIYLTDSINSILMNNTANSNRDCGILLYYSSNSTLTNNSMSGNRWNFGVSGNTACHYNPSDYTQNVDTSNLVNGKPVYYWIDQQNKQIPCDAGFVGIVNSSNITVRDLTLTNNCEGVLFAYTNNSIIENITVSKNDLSIFLASSSNNVIVENDVSDSHHGISISYSGDNTIKDNVIVDSERSIRLSYSKNNMLVNNTASNNFHGIGMYHSSNNVITNSNASDNDVGIFLTYSSNNNMLRNNIASDNNVGIYFFNASYNNTFVNNIVANNDNGIYLSSSNNNISYNDIIKNGVLQSDGSYHWQLYDNQYQPVEAKHNYWGAGMDNNTIDASIYDDEEGGWGEVEFYPFETEPVPCAPTPDNTSGPTYVSGFISTNTTWTSVDSPYIVRGDVVVEEGVKLIIDPGVTVKFESEKELIIDGILNANGNKQDKVIFTSANLSASPEDWGSIYFRKGSTGSITNCSIAYTNKGVKIEYSSPLISECEISNSATGIWIRGGQSWSGGAAAAPEILNNRIHDNFGHGICAYGHCGSPIICGNVITNNSGGISVGNGDCCTEQHIINNTVNSNGGWGIRVDTTGTIEVRHNNVTRNNDGIYLHAWNTGPNVQVSNNYVYGSDRGMMLVLCNTYLTVSNNTLDSNEKSIYVSNFREQEGKYLIKHNNVINSSEYAVYCSVSRNYARQINLSFNYWNTTNTTLINQLIYDYYDNYDLTKVIYVPFLTELVPCAPTPEEPPAFTTADAVIAPQLASGSRPPDPRWDVSRDGSVTSLDALMILQAAGGSIEIG